MSVYDILAAQEAKRLGVRRTTLSRAWMAAVVDPSILALGKAEVDPGVRPRRRKIQFIETNPWTTRLTWLLDSPNRAASPWIVSPRSHNAVIFPLRWRRPFRSGNTGQWPLSPPRTSQMASIVGRDSSSQIPWLLAAAKRSSRVGITTPFFSPRHIPEPTPAAKAPLPRPRRRTRSAPGRGNTCPLPRRAT